MAAFLLRSFVHRNEIHMLPVLYRIRQFFLICNALFFPLLEISLSVICALLPIMLPSPLFWVIVAILLFGLSFTTHKLLSYDTTLSLP